MLIKRTSKHKRNRSCKSYANFNNNRTSKENQSVKKTNKKSCAQDVFDLFHERLKDEKQEHFYVLMLDTKNNITGEQLISKGTLDASIIHPREVFKPAIKNSASKIILVHNHPSGDPKPSEEDLEITEKLIDTGKQIGINVLDNVIIEGQEFWSWRESSKS